jgi:hypothetical protein
MFVRCVFTVCTEIDSTWAISLLPAPRATRRAIAVSRSVSCPPAPRPSGFDQLDSFSEERGRRVARAEAARPRLQHADGERVIIALGHDDRLRERAEGADDAERRRVGVGADVEQDDRRHERRDLALEPRVGGDVDDLSALRRVRQALEQTSSKGGISAGDDEAAATAHAGRK